MSRVLKDGEGFVRLREKGPLGRKKSLGRRSKQAWVRVGAMMFSGLCVKLWAPTPVSRKEGVSKRNSWQ